jgi:hypothetical protein
LSTEILKKIASLNIGFRPINYSPTIWLNLQVCLVLLSFSTSSIIFYFLII